MEGTCDEDEGKKILSTEQHATAIRINTSLAWMCRRDGNLGMLDRLRRGLGGRGGVWHAVGSQNDVMLRSRLSALLWAWAITSPEQVAADLGLSEGRSRTRTKVRTDWSTYCMRRVFVWRTMGRGAGSRDEGRGLLDDVRPPT